MAISDKNKRVDRPRRRQEHERRQEQNNHLFQELFHILATDQRKLRDLEQRREQLIEEMRELRSRLFEENANLRRTIQAGAAVEPAPTPSTSRAARNGAPRGASNRSAPNRSAPKRVATRSASFHSQGATPTTTKRRQRKPAATQRVSSRLVGKREEQMPDAHVHSHARGHVSAPAVARRIAGVPKRTTLPKRNVRISAQNRQNITARTENNTEEVLYSLAARLERERQASSSTGPDDEHQSTGQHPIPAPPPTVQSVSATGLESNSEVLSYTVPTNPPPSLSGDSDQHEFEPMNEFGMHSVPGFRLLQRIADCLKSK